MVWQAPKTNWQNYDIVTPEDMNRIEGNISELKKASTIDIADTAGNFTATNVEDALQELAGTVQTGKNSIASSITAMGQSASGTETFSSLATKIRAISTDATAGTGDVLLGKTFYQGGSKKTGTMPNRGSPTWTPGTSNIVLPSGYYSGGTIVGDPDLVPANIKQGVNIFGVTGTVPVGDVLFAPNNNKANMVAGYLSGTNAVATVNSEYLHLEVKAQGEEASIVTNNPIDLTVFRKIYVTSLYRYGNADAYLVVSPVKIASYTSYTVRSLAGSHAEVDVTSLTGLYYVRIHLFQYYVPETSYSYKQFNFVFMIG